VSPLNPFGYLSDGTIMVVSFEWEVYGSNGARRVSTVT
jgi:hypothetical protein